MRLTPFILAIVFAAGQSAAISIHAQVAQPVVPAELRTFNDALSDATRRMDNAALVALWEDDGVSLLPSTRPIAGKKAISDFITSVTSQMGSARMLKFTNDCHDGVVSGDWASEWCIEHQVVALGNDKTFDGWGKLLFILHRGTDGKWRLREEMWNQASPADSTFH